MTRLPGIVAVGCLVQLLVTCSSRGTVADVPLPCADTATVRTLADTLHGMSQPVLRTVIPPEPVTERRDVGRTFELHFVVGVDGNYDEDTLILEPLPSRTTENSLRSTLRLWRFTPAIMQACAVPAWTTFTFTL